MESSLNAGRGINEVAEIRRRVGQLAETVVTGGPSEICAALDNLEESVTAMRVVIERARALGTKAPNAKLRDR